MSTHLIGTFKARCHDFINTCHEVCGFLDDIIYFYEGGGFAHRVILNSKLKGLYIGWNFV